MKGNLWYVLIVFVFVAIGLFAIPTALSDNADVNNTNETHSLTSASETKLNQSETWYRLVENETVKSTNGTVYDRGEDYEIDYQNGTLTAVSGSEADGDDVYVDYYYETIDQRSEEIAGLLSTMEWAMPWLFFIVVIGTLLAWTGWL